MLQKSYAEGMRALVLYTASLQDAVQLAAARAASDDGGGAQRPAAAGRQGRRLRAGLRDARRCRCRPWAAPGSCRTTRWSSTSGTRRSTACTRARRRSRAWTCSSARSSVTHGAGITSLLAADPAVRPGGQRPTARSRPSARPWPMRPAASRRYSARSDGYAIASLGRPAEIYKVGQHTSRFLMAFGDLVIGWLLARQAEVAAQPSAPRVSPRLTTPSTRASSRRRNSSPPRSCPAWSPTKRSSSKPPTTSWTSPSRRSNPQPPSRAFPQPAPEPRPVPDPAGARRRRSDCVVA